MIKKIRKFIDQDIWLIKIENHSFPLRFLLKQLRIILLAVKGFKMDRIQLRASALTYYTTMSVVPIAAMVFGIAQGFGFQERLKTEIERNLAERGELQEAVDYILQFADNMLANINGGFIAGIGLAVLFWSVMSVLGNIEKSFNAIWRIKKSRPFVRKFSDYLSMMLIAPVLFFLSSTVTVFLNEFASQDGSFFQLLGPVLKFLVKLIPYALIYLLFTLMYVIMPNTKVQFKNGLFAGLIAGTIFQLTQWVYVTFQVGVSRYGAIYSGFMALPLFLIWLQLSWLIVLLGAEISFSYQNIESYEFDSEIHKVNPYNKRLLTFLIMHLIIKQFARAEPPMTSSDISRELGIPIRLVRDILYDLQTAQLVLEAQTESPKVTAYVPATDINKISISYVIESLETGGESNLVADQTDDLEAFNGIQSKILKTIQQSEANKLIKDI